ncbi:hypothetical protein DXG01_005878 [Tephrocybe rancida]|nr:hypothetical protein DXG01_005878 [Tephrocybe rancida]
MNDPGLGEPIQEGFQHVTRSLRDKTHHEHHESQQSLGPRAAFRHELEVDEEEEQVGFNQPKRWWFTSTAFPLIAGTFGPLANLFSVCALVQTWRVAIPEGETETKGSRVSDPAWLLVLNAVSLALALLANVMLLLNFAHRVRYTVAQPLTIILWYISAILLIIPLGMTSDLVIHPTSTHAFAQSYYYAIISATLYIVVSSLLVLNVMGAYVFKEYPPSFNSLTIPQRTLMLQTVSYILYLALGAGVFSAIEGWAFCDGLYWADYTLLTIGIGSDFPLLKSVSRALLIPYAAFGIMMIGLLVGSVRGLVLERGKTKMVKRSLAKERETLKRDKRGSGDMSGWKKQEFECMRRMENRAQIVQRYSALGTSFFVFVVVWLAGALVFWFSEMVPHPSLLSENIKSAHQVTQRPQKWTYFEALYFSYTSLLTIGYGDFYPQSNSGKPFFVVWSLIAIPTVTVLISNLGDTLVTYLKNGLLWVGERTLLPERHKHRVKAIDVGGKKKAAEESQADASDSATGLGGDVERLGEAIEKGEEERGHAGSLTARIAKEISRLAKDVGASPAVQYGWNDWDKWLDMLGMHDRQRAEGPLGNVAQEWTWLADDGPLFSWMSETEWVLEKLCTRLEQVLEEELREARRSSNHK